MVSHGHQLVFCDAESSVVEQEVFERLARAGFPVFLSGQLGSDSEDVFEAGEYSFDDKLPTIFVIELRTSIEGGCSPMSEVENFKFKEKAEALTSAMMQLYSIDDGYRSAFDETGCQPELNISDPNFPDVVLFREDIWKFESFSDCVSNFETFIVYRTE